MIVTPVDFIKETKTGIKVIDVRSPAEFNHAHFPNAVNLPLLNDEERKIIGITFKQEGREAAIIKGFELVGHKFSGFIKAALKIAPEKKILVYCWRGGLRSNILAWLLQTSGFRVTLLKGGYKSFRNWALATINESKKVIVIGGKTGCGKTEILNHLKKKSQQVIDLEKLASHRGSAFGSIGLPEQPSNEQFENLLALEWYDADENKILFLENESRRIGKIVIPQNVFELMRSANVIEISADKEQRTKRILDEYGKYGTEILIEKTKKIADKLGGLRLKEAIVYLENNQLENWCEMMLEYYDKQYTHSSHQRNPQTIVKSKADITNLDKACEHILKEINDCFDIRK